MVADYAQQLVRYLYLPIPCLARALSALILTRIWVIGLWCFLSTTLAAVCMAKGEPFPFHRTQGAPPHRTCMSSMGHQWAGTYVLYHCDNVAAVCQVNHLFARDPIAAHLLHCLALSMALYDFCTRAVHIARCMNVGADQLSRDRAMIFLDCHPTALLLPMQIPQELTDLLLSPQHSWTSPLWRQLCGDFGMRV